eukprot:4727852-Amphidinium_carterae.1
MRMLAAQLHIISSSITCQVRFCSWQVSTFGRVCDTRGRISYGSPRGDGARQVNIGQRMFKVHRLVAFAHLGLPPTSLHQL